MSSKPGNDSRCDDCYGPIFNGEGPPDGWQLDDGRSVCDDCCASDLRQMVESIRAENRSRQVH